MIPWEALQEGSVTSLLGGSLMSSLGGSLGSFLGSSLGGRDVGPGGRGKGEGKTPPTPGESPRGSADSECSTLSLRLLAIVLYGLSMGNERTLPFSTGLRLPKRTDYRFFWIVLSVQRCVTHALWFVFDEEEPTRERRTEMKLVTTKRDRKVSGVSLMCSL